MPVYEPDIGLTRLETVRVSRAAADQRRGRAGRTEPGICYRLWEEAATGRSKPSPRPEILSADLAPLLLDCAAWGVTDPTRLRFLDPPPAPALKEARALLQQLHALDRDGRITETGRSLRATAPAAAACHDGAEARRAAGRSAKRPISRPFWSNGAWAATPSICRSGSSASGASGRSGPRTCGAWPMDGRAQRIAAPRAELLSVGALVAFAYPDRIAKARGKAGDFLMANGRGGSVEPHDRLAKEPYLAVAEITGGAASAWIVAAAAIGADEIDVIAGADILSRDEVAFDRQARALRAVRSVATALSP